MSDSTLVYSSESGRVCPQCEQPLDVCTCNPSAHPKDGPKTVRVSVSRQGRKGKTVTSVKGLRMTSADLKAYAGKLKKKVGSGGTLKEGVIEIQGDYRDPITARLRQEGWDVKH